MLGSIIRFIKRSEREKPVYQIIFLGITGSLRFCCLIFNVRNRFI